MAAVTLFIFSLLVSTTFAGEDIEKEERSVLQALPSQLNAGQKEFYFHLYYHEIFSGPGKTTDAVITPNSDFPNFAQVLIYDAPMWDSLKEKTVIARAQGAAFQANQNTYGWLLSYNIMFETGNLKGSTLQVMGQALQLTTSRQLSIVGGTGILTMAQGVVYGRKLSSPDDSLWIEQKIHGYYTPMQQPPWN